MSENNFTKMETEGRKLFTSFHTQIPELWGLTFTVDTYDSTDIIYLSGVSATNGEIKTRDYNHTQRWNGTPEGWIFEKRKWSELKKLRTPGSDSVYINIFKDALVIWEVSQVEEERFFWKLCWENHKCERKVMKEVCYLSINEAAHIFKHQFQFKNKPQ